jgi:PIN domain nuclease of toxin-antitoxin system
LNYLLDTGVWLWSLWAPERISDKALAEIRDPSNEVFLSAVTAWEIAIKAASGKLRLPEAPGAYVPRRMADQGLRPLPILHSHALAVFDLPDHHRDPFDRLLIAQTKLEGLVLVTADRIVEKYPVDVLRAGR